MKIEHAALYVNDLEKARSFFVNYLGAESNDGYHNPRTGFRSYFLSFDGSARLEIVNICQREPALFLTVDGRVNIKLVRGDSVKITRSDKSAGIVRLKEDSFYGTFRRKMSGI